MMNLFRAWRVADNAETLTMQRRAAGSACPRQVQEPRRRRLLRGPADPPRGRVRHPRGRRGDQEGHRPRYDHTRNCARQFRPRAHVDRVRQPTHFTAFRNFVALTGVVLIHGSTPPGLDHFAQLVGANRCHWERNHGSPCCKERIATGNHYTSHGFGIFINLHDGLSRLFIPPYWRLCYRDQSRSKTKETASASFFHLFCLSVL